MAAGLNKSTLRTSQGRTWIKISATVQQAEALLDTEYGLYAHEAGFRRLGEPGIFPLLPGDSELTAFRRRLHLLLCPTSHKRSYRANYANPAFVCFSLAPPLRLPLKFRRHPSDHPAARAHQKNYHRNIIRDRWSPIPGVSRKIGQPGFGSDAKLSPLPFASSMPDAALTNCSTVTTLDSLRQLYSIDYNQTKTETNTFGIGESLPPLFYAVALTDHPPRSRIYSADFHR